MIKLIAAMVIGIIAGFSGMLPKAFLTNTGTITTCAFCFVLVSAGIDLGSNRKAFQRIKEAGFRVLLLPLGIIIGSVLPGILAGLLLGFTWSEGAAISSGFGYYSLSAVILQNLKGPEFATIAFLHNMMREVLTFIFLPVTLKYVGKIPSIAPAGATSMDTTLPIYIKFLGQEIGLLAFISGVLLTLAVPILVPIFGSMH